MKLPEEEERELEELRGMASSNSQIMLERQQDRHLYLVRKKFQNDCVNPSCTGYEGTEDEIKCPKCGKGLFKHPGFKIYP